MNKVCVFLSLFLLTNLLLASTYYATTQPNITNYYLNPDGSVLVELMFLNVSQQTIEVSLEQGFDASTLHAVDSDGVSLPIDVVGDKVLINVVSSVKWVKLTYLIPENAEVSDGIVFKFVLRPQGDCTIHVSEDFMLLTFTGSPVIDLVDETLLLEYKGIDVVEVTVVMLQPVTQITTNQTTINTTTNITTNITTDQTATNQTTTSLPPSQPGIEGSFIIAIVAATVIILVLVMVLFYRKHK
ncbi:MAG: hypothetical protein QN229_01855 [Desulfurococcaceae archaeon TW002]